MSLTSDILARCEGLGFALAGVASLEPSERTRELRDWLSAGKHGEMEYLTRNREIRENPARLIENARCAIMVADQYARRGETDGEPAPGRGRIARYARGDDYHVVMKRRLHVLCDGLRAEHPGHSFRAFVDTAPVQERELAMRAGLGWIGKHTLLIHPRLGSWLLLGGIATTLVLDGSRERVPDHCGACTRCLDACPTSCITPYSVDASRCVSYLTIEHRSAIPTELGHAIGDWIFGCDICQEVCPHNSPRPPGAEVGAAHPAYTPRQDSFDLFEVLGWNEEDRTQTFRKSAMKRASLDMMKRNARTVLEKSDEATQRRSDLRDCASDEPRP